MAEMTLSLYPLFGYAGQWPNSDTASRLLAHARRHHRAPTDTGGNELGQGAFVTAPGVVVDGELLVAVEGAPLVGVNASECSATAAARAIVDLYRSHGRRFLDQGTHRRHRRDPSPTVATAGLGWTLMLPCPAALLPGGSRSSQGI